MGARAESIGAVELFAITPGRGDAHELREKIAALARGGVTRLLLREKQLDAAARAALGETVAEACRAAGLELWVSDDVALAARLGAHGVHLSERSPPPSRLAAQAGALAFGLSLHQPVSRPASEIARCRHAFVAPLFATPSKPGVAPLGVAGFAEIAATLPLPVYALGGIELDHTAALAALARAGIRRVAAIRLFFDARDPAAAARLLAERLRATPAA